MRPCQIIAHRGGSLEVPENTRTAVAHTAQIGLAWMETDVHATADGVVVLAHDGDYARTMGNPQKIEDLTWSELAQVDGGDGQAPIRLDEALEEFPQLSFNIDLKDAPVVAPAVATVARLGAWERVRFASFSSRRLRQARALAPQARTSLGMAEVAALVGAAQAALPERYGWGARMLGGAPVVTRRPDAVQVPISQWGIPVVTPRFIAAAHRRGLEVHVWTIDNPAEMKRLAAMGVDGIVTDVPTLAQRVLG